MKSKATRPNWIPYFYPPAGVRDSPVDFIDALTDKKDVAVIKNHIKALINLYPWEWQNIESFDSGFYHKAPKDFKIYQLTAGDFRIYLSQDNKDGKELIVVGYICRKMGMKAKEKDKRKAARNLQDYFDFGRNSL